jgi:hypothetical protein
MISALTHSKKLKNKPLPIHLLVLTAGIFLILVSFATVSIHDFELTFMNSDCMYLPSIFKDVFIDKGDVSYWSFNAAPNVFPDMILYFLLAAVTKDFVISSILYSIIQYIIIALLVDSIYRKINLENQMFNRIWIQLILLIPHTFTIFTQDFFLHFQFLSNAYHLGALINTLLCLYIYQIIRQNKYDSRNVIRTILFLGLIYLSSVSDKLFWLWFLFPLFLLSVFHYYIKKNYSSILFCGLSIVTFVLSNWTLNTIRYTKPKIDVLYRYFSADYIGESIQIFTRQMKTILLEGNIKSIFIGLVGITIILFLFKTIRLIFRHQELEITPKNEFTIFLTCSLVLGIIAPLANGSYSGYDTIRYNFPVMILALVGFAFATSSILPVIISRFLLLLVMLINFALIFLLIVEIDNFKKKWNFFPQQTTEIEMLTKQYHLKAGVSEYWVAKKNDIFNTKQIKILPILENRIMYIHANSKYWYLYQRKSKKQQVFDFAIIEYEDQIEQFKKLFNCDCPIVQFGETRIMLTPEFIFNPQTELIELFATK